MMDALPFRWTGDAMQPLNGHFARRCDAQFVVGETYTLAAVEDRSAASHRHYFAALNDAWLNLPEDQAERFPTCEHFRKWLLIRCGYSDQRQLVCSSKAEALRIAAFLRPSDEYAVVTATEAVVTVYTAKSQSTKAMGRKEFGDSKQKVLDLAASMIDVSRNALVRNAGMAA